MPTSKTGTLAANSPKAFLRQKGFTLIELTVVLAILSMMAGVILPSAAAFIQRNRLEQLAFDISLLCRETFEQAVYSGRPHCIQLRDNNKLVAFYEANSQLTEATGVLLRPVIIPSECSVDWPEKGWQTMPEGFCETPLLHITDKEGNETLIMRIRAYDANLIKETEQFAGTRSGKL